MIIIEGGVDGSTNRNITVAERITYYQEALRYLLGMKKGEAVKENYTVEEYEAAIHGVLGLKNGSEL